jgi:replicative DNA helicase
MLLDKKGLPSNVEVERLVLGAVLTDPTAMAACRPVLSLEDFSIERNRSIWRKAVELYDAGVPVDRVTMANEFARRNELEHDTLSYLVSLDDGMPQIHNLDAYVKILLDESLRRRIILLCQSVTDRAVARDDPRDLLDHLSQQAASIVVSKDSEPQLISAKDLVDQKGIVQILAPRLERGMSFPWTWMTQATCGMLPGELWVLAAHTGCGKSSAAMQVAVHAARHGHRVVIFSAEMDATSLFQRAVWQLSGVDADRAKRNKVSKDERERLNLAAATLYELPVLFSRRSSFTTLDIYHQLRRERAKGPIGLIVVDYLQLISDSGRHETRAQAVGMAARACKLMGGEFECPVLLLSQFNRESAKPGRARRPELTDLKESGDIENHANAVWIIHRESMMDEDRITVEFILAKQRDGRRNVMQEFWFVPKFQRFEEKEAAT